MKCRKSHTNKAMSSGETSMQVEAVQTGRRIPGLAVLVLLGLTLVMFADVLFTSQPIALSRRGTDISMQFIYLRDFGFGELADGNLPLWNPHLFSGAPFVGGFLSAMLYPPNLLHLVLPDTLAINWLIASHVFLCGLGMYVWSRSKGLSWPASLLAGSIFMFCGAYFLHIFAGHLTVVLTAPWIPLFFWSLDKYRLTRSPGRWFAGTFFLAMAVLAGHPQTVFYTLIAAGLYCSIDWVKAQHRGWLLAGWSSMLMAAFALAAIQILPGLAMTGESVRSQNNYAFATQCSFPPENFITLLAPCFLGDDIHLPYWGRWYIWEMCLFIGVIGLVLAIYGMLRGPKEQRRLLWLLILILLLLALGSNTPFYKMLYDYIPGISTFRANCKFGLEASLFLALLAGIGFDVFHRSCSHTGKRRCPTALLITVTTGAMLTAAAALLFYHSADNAPFGWWEDFIHAMSTTGETFMRHEYYSFPAFPCDAAKFTSYGLFITAGTLLLLTISLWTVRYADWIKYAPIALAVIEIFAFARFYRATYDPSDKSPAMMNVERFIKEHPGDYRILNTDIAEIDSAMSMNAKDIWGYDPIVSLRYAQFMAFTQGQDPDSATIYLKFPHFHKLYSMLRARYRFSFENNEFKVLDAGEPLPRLLLVRDYQVLQNRDQIFAALDNSSFDPAQQVILEADPQMQGWRPNAKVKNSSDSVTIVDSSTDHLTIEAEVSEPAILLITDGYSRDWQASALPGSNQDSYQIMPANYVLMAIPLQKGYHRFIVEYLPASFVAGEWISIAGLLIYASMLGWYALSLYQGIPWPPLRKLTGKGNN